jgi:hypothetical protein
MKRPSNFSLSAITAMGLALMASYAVAQQRTLKERLVGSWMLVSNDNVAPEGAQPAQRNIDPLLQCTLPWGSKPVILKTSNLVCNASTSAQ